MDGIVNNGPSIDPMMSMLLQMCSHIRSTNLIFKNVKQTDFNIPLAQWSCKFGLIGLALLQDEDSRLRGEAVIHISGCADDRRSMEGIAKTQHEIASLIETARANLGILEIHWQ